MENLNRNITYTERDFNSFRTSLIDYSKTYFPNTYNDFTPDSTGMLFIEMASYVGDVLSFYLDNQIQETFIQYARQEKNLFDLAYMFGYKPRVTTAATTDISLYQQLPATTDASGATVPDFTYCLKIPTGFQLIANNNSNIRFITEDVCDFSVSSSQDPTDISIYSLLGNQPNRFLLKKTRKAVSGTINSITQNFTTPTRFSSVDLNAENIIGILDVFDSNGNQWYEVLNLAQDTVFTTKINASYTDPNAIQDDAPNLLNLKQIQRRFTTRFLSSTVLQLGFGAGTVSDNDENLVPNPDNVGTGLAFSKDKLTTAYSPLNFMFTDTYGIAPSNTTLTIRYLTGGGLNSNVPSGTLTNFSTDGIVFNNPNISSTTLANDIFSSIATNNILAADGGQGADSVEEIRQNALGNFQNQLRTVTQQDYLIRALSMPANIGTIAKAYIQPTKVAEYQLGELPTILDMYVLSYNSSRKLRTASKTLKQNLKTYLSEYRMINDSIKIKDAYIINIMCEFDIIVLPNFNNNDVILRCINALSSYFNINNWNVNQPIMLKNLSILLDKVEGVQTVTSVVIKNIAGISKGYSQYSYDLSAATNQGIIYPSIDPMIFELKYPSSDIVGRVVPL
jgi:hypothetical protein|tara:strand:+ start:3070 stop:4932 length:1863 start_codon:yes stop_codon:yes gene_type:complete